MAGWEDQLAELLRELGVTQEESSTHLRSIHISEADYSQGKPLLWPKKKDDIKRHVQSALFWGSADDRSDASNESHESDDDIEEEEARAWMSDLGLMRREVESIVKQIVYLMQHGDLDNSIKEDVMVVLLALRRRAAVTQQAAASEVAYLEFAAAMLHFCRIVLRLSEVATEDF